MINKQAFRLKTNGKPYCNCLCRHPEFIENYEKAIADTTQIWECHHRLETHNSDGERRLVDLAKEELIALDVYYDRPASELIFLTGKEHATLHNRSLERRRKISEMNKGRPQSEESNRKRSETMKGHKVSAETRRKMSEAKKRNTSRLEKHPLEETRREISKSHKGTHWYNNDVKSVRAFECPDGFRPGRI